MENTAIDIQYYLDEIHNCAKSFQYFINNYCYIEDKESGQAIPFKLWPGQIKVLPLILSALLLIVLKARQLGLTWLIAAYCLWRALFKQLELIVVISAKEDWAIEFLERVRFMRTRLPDWMQPPILKDTGEQLVFNHNGLNSTIKSLPTTPEGAQSKTPTLLIVDESALNRYLKKIYAASKPGIDVAKGQMIIISNAIKTGPGWSFTRNLYSGAIKGINGFKRIFLPWWEHPGRDKKHFLAQQKAEGMDDDDISQHYPSSEQEAITTLLGSYFGKALARHNKASPGIEGNLIESKQDDIEFIEGNNGILEIWRYPYMLIEKWDKLFWNNRYAIGSDIGEGLGVTYSVAYVMDRKTDEIIARMRSRRIDAYKWANMLFLLSKYYDNALICPERNGPGITSCQRLLELNAKVYSRLTPAKAGEAPSDYIGWLETEATKHELCGYLKNWLRTTKSTIFCGIFLEEASTFIRHDNGKLEAEQGNFDDCVMAFGLTLQSSRFIGTPPSVIKTEPTGWRERFKAGQL